MNFEDQISQAGMHMPTAPQICGFTGKTSWGAQPPPRILGCFQVSHMMLSAKYLDAFSTVLGCAQLSIHGTKNAFCIASNRIAIPCASCYPMLQLSMDKKHDLLIDVVALSDAFTSPSCLISIGIFILF